MHATLRSALARSGLFEREAAEAAFVAEWTLQAGAGPFTVQQDLVQTYSFRAAHVSRLAGAHWERLARSTEEFARNVALQVGTSGQFVSLKGHGPERFLMFYSASRESVEGCMFVLPNAIGEHNILTAAPDAA